MKTSKLMKAWTPQQIHNRWKRGESERNSNERLPSRNGRSCWWSWHNDFMFVNFCNDASTAKFTGEFNGPKYYFKDRVWEVFQKKGCCFLRRQQQCRQLNKCFVKQIKIVFSNSPRIFCVCSCKCKVHIYNTTLWIIFSVFALKSLLKTKWRDVKYTYIYNKYTVLSKINNSLGLFLTNAVA